MDLKGGRRGKTAKEDAKEEPQGAECSRGKKRWCFPGRDGESHGGEKSVSKQVGDRQHPFKQRKALPNRRHDNSPVLSGGENGEWTPHDLRRTGATTMQPLGVSQT